MKTISTTTRKPVIFFIISIGAESSLLWVADRSHNNIHMPEEPKRVMADFMEMQAIPIPANYIFGEHSYVRNVGGLVRCCVYPISNVPYPSMTWVFGCGFPCIQVEFREGRWSCKTDIFIFRLLPYEKCSRLVCKNLIIWKLEMMMLQTLESTRSRSYQCGTIMEMFLRTSIQISRKRDKISPILQPTTKRKTLETMASSFMVILKSLRAR